MALRSRRHGDCARGSIAEGKGTGMGAEPGAESIPKAAVASPFLCPNPFPIPRLLLQPLLVLRPLLILLLPPLQHSPCTCTYFCIPPVASALPAAGFGVFASASASSSGRVLVLRVYYVCVAQSPSSQNRKPKKKTIGELGRR